MLRKSIRRRSLSLKRFSYSTTEDLSGSLPVLIFNLHRHRSSSASTPGRPGNASSSGRLVGAASGSTQISSSTFTTYVEETPKLCGYLLKQSEFSSAASIAASKAASAAATIGQFSTLLKDFTHFMHISKFLSGEQLEFRKVTMPCGECRG